MLRHIPPHPSPISGHCSSPFGSGGLLAAICRCSCSITYNQESWMGCSRKKDSYRLSTVRWRQRKSAMDWLSELGLRHPSVSMSC